MQMSNYTGPDPNRIRSMFASISTRYDRANTVLSGGVHHLWRTKAVRWSQAKEGDRVLDCATGTGDLAIAFRKAVGASGRVVGTDFVPEMLSVAREKAPDITFEVADVTRLPYDDASFDVAFTISVLHHVPPAERSRFMAEMLRTIRPRGAAIIIEHNPLNPITRRIVSRCAFDADAVLLGSRETAKLLADGGAPALGRRYLGFWPFRNAFIERAERAITWLPMGAQYCMWGIKSA